MGLEKTGQGWKKWDNVGKNGTTFMFRNSIEKNGTTFSQIILQFILFLPFVLPKFCRSYVEEDLTICQIFVVTFLKDIPYFEVFVKKNVQEYSVKTGYKIVYYL